MDDHNDGDGRDAGDRGENDSDDDASLSLKCRTPACIKLWAQTASELETIQRLQDAECQKPYDCMHI